MLKNGLYNTALSIIIHFHGIGNDFSQQSNIIVPHVIILRNIKYPFSSANSKKENNKSNNEIVDKIKEYF